MSFSQLLARLKSDVEKPGSDVVIRAIGLITVEEIKTIGRSYTTPTHFEVWEKPTPNNPDHAEIVPYEFAAQAAPKKDVSRGLSKLISNALDLTLLTPTGAVDGYNPPLQQ